MDHSSLEALACSSNILCSDQIYVLIVYPYVQKFHVDNINTFLQEKVCKSCRYRPYNSRVHSLYILILKKKYNFLTLLLKT